MRTNKRGKQFYLNIISMLCDSNDTMSSELCDEIQNEAMLACDACDVMQF